MPNHEKPDYEILAKLADECGFSYSAPLNISTLEFMQDVRDMCNADKCDKYNTSWSCPPACASLEDMRARVMSYSGGLLVQTVGELEDSYDWEGIMETGARHKKNFARLWDALEEDNASVYAMGAGVCGLCATCTYPDEACRFPDRMSASMEACGLFVSKVCTDNGLAYNYGSDKIAFTSCFLVSVSGFESRHPK
jgi:predicted metal-binding protein